MNAIKAWLGEVWAAIRTIRRGQVPGMVAVALLTVATAFWTFWGVAEMFYEGWWGPWYLRLLYMIPPAICLALTLLVFIWPRAGGAVIVVAGMAFTLWWLPMLAQRAGGSLSLGALLTLLPVSAAFVLIGGLFLWEGRRLARLRREGASPPARWWVRQARYLVGVGVPLLIALGVVIDHVPLLAGRVDRGDRSARLIEGNGVTLVWVPEGPGWSRGADWEGRGIDTTLPAVLDWNELAFYGRSDAPEDANATPADMASTGLCRYLTADGLTLAVEPQDIWRLPTVDEIVRSLVWRGENAGCTWDGVSNHADCPDGADKDWPLWATDWSPVYYWAADEYDAEDAWYVSCTGRGISHQPKEWGNPRHGYRCVREPGDEDT